MKAKKLAELLMKHPDFEVNLVTLREDNEKLAWPIYTTYNVIGIADIGWSSKIIQLDVKEN